MCSIIREFSHTFLSILNSRPFSFISLIRSFFPFIVCCIHFFSVPHFRKKIRKKQNNKTTTTTTRRHRQTRRHAGAHLFLIYLSRGRIIQTRTHAGTGRGGGADRRARTHARRHAHLLFLYLSRGGGVVPHHGAS